MKWAKPKKHLGLLRNRLAEANFILDKDADNAAYLAAVNKYYYEIEDKPTLDSLWEKGFRVWLSVKKVPAGYKKARARYEAFVGGYLYFFEKHVSKIPKDDRALYFDWGVLNKNNGLTIFINPLYAKSVVKEDGKKGITDPKNLAVFNGKFAKQENGNERVQLMRKRRTENLTALAIAPPPGTSGPVDPPPPPPPPPPPRD